MDAQVRFYFNRTIWRDITTMFNFGHMAAVQPILKIFLPFFLGLVAFFYAVNTFPSWLTADTSFVLAWVIVALLGLYALSVLLNKAFSGFHFLLWFLVAGLLVLLNQPQNDPKHFTSAETDVYQAVVDHMNQSKEKKSKFIRCELSVEYAFNQQGKIEVTGKIIAFIDSSFAKKINRNDKLLVNSVPERIVNQGNPGEFDLQLFSKSKGFEHQWFLDSNDVILLSKGAFENSVFDKIRKGVVSSLSSKLDGDVLAVALGILLGDKTYLTIELKDAFSGSGAMHLLAVSGLHVGIFLMILQGLFQIFGYKLPSWIRFLCIVSILWLYAGITGFSPSVNRAVTMFSFVALGTVLGKRYNSMDGLLASAMILLVIEPNYLFDIGFQLSYGAMVGIFLFSPLLADAFHIKNKWIKFAWSGTAVALAAQLTTFPLTLYYFHQFPNYFLLTNLGLMLISWFIMALGLGIIGLGSIPLIGSLVTWIFVLIVSALITFVQWISELPGSITQGFRLQMWEVLLLYFGIALLSSSLFNKRKLTLYSSLAIFSVFVIFQSFNSIQDIRTSELLVLNNNDPVFFIRRGKNADMIVISNKPNIETKMDFVKRSLDIYYGVETKLHVSERKRGQLRSTNGKVVFVTKSGLVHLQISGKWYTYIYGDYFKENDLIEPDYVLTGPWLNRAAIEAYIDDSPLWELKKQGAFKVEL